MEFEQKLIDARLAEAKWWRNLVFMHEDSYFAVEGGKRIRELQGLALQIRLTNRNTPLDYPEIGIPHLTEETR